MLSLSLSVRSVDMIIIYPIPSGWIMNVCCILLAKVLERMDGLFEFGAGSSIWNWKEGGDIFM